MSGKVVNHSDAELARLARIDAQELDKIHSDFVKDLPCHYWPRFNGFCVGENRESVIRLCLDDLRFLHNALDCYEHWILSEETKNISPAMINGVGQQDVSKKLEQLFSLRKFLIQVEVPDVVNDEDIPF